MRVVGTAGHVDHGKSTLIEALTGTHPDRLKEEREREMTIDLGFAWLTLPAVGELPEEEIGIIDVPGHRDFIENMLAGVGGIDAVLFVVAADEGVMPQTREHLAILNLLQIEGGVVALTKIDLIEGDAETRADWLDLVEEELRQTLAAGILAEAPIVRVSARTGEGLARLQEALRAALANRPPRPDLNRPRLPVDRVFTMAGFGTIVTGTLIDGHLQVGDEIETLPQGLRGRVRGLQTHKRKEETAVPGSRTAVNISGLAVDEIQRGSVIAHPGDYRPTRRMDAAFELLPDVSAPIKHNMEVKLFIGAAEMLARLRLIGSEELAPGHEGWLQLELLEPVVAVKGDRYILRRPSPGETLGGGVIIDPHPRGRHKRFAGKVLERLEALAAGTPADILHQALLSLGAAPLKEVVERANLDAPRAAQAVAELSADGRLVVLDGPGAPPLRDDTLVASLTFWETLSGRILKEISDHHRAYPLRLGMPREALRSRLKPLTQGSGRIFTAALDRLVAAEQVHESGPWVALPEHKIVFSPELQKRIDRLLARFAAAPFAPPTVKESQAEIGEEAFNALLALDQLVSVNPEVAFRRQDYDRMVADIRRMLSGGGEITAAEARDHFQTSRRYALALLEHLDAAGVTVRAGDVRRLRG